MAITTLAVANGKYFGGGMQVAPQADTHDGQFHVTVWSGYGLSDFALKQGGIYSGEHVKWKGTRTLQCKELKAEPVRQGDEVLLDVDGEQPGKLPCRMRILPSAIRLKV
jgi:diacylglycerol kinase family enzyme